MLKGPHLLGELRLILSRIQVSGFGYIGMRARVREKQRVIGEREKGNRKCSIRGNERRGIERQTESSRVTNQFILSRWRAHSRLHATSRPVATCFRTHSRERACVLCTRCARGEESVRVCTTLHIPHLQLHSRCSMVWRELALFYRKGLIALPITDNATINDLGVEREDGRPGEWTRCAKGLDRIGYPVALPLHCRLGSSV